MEPSSRPLFPIAAVPPIQQPLHLNANEINCVSSLFPVMPTLENIRSVIRMTKHRLRRTCTLDEIKKDISFLHPPPNGGWGWVVVVAAATHCLLVSGFHSAFGVYMLPLLDTFKSSNSRIAWIGSVSYASIMIFGPVSGKLLVKYGAIKVAIIGDLVVICGLVCSSYTHDLRLLFFTHGIIVGVGSSLAYTPGLIMVSLYFTTKRSFATGLVMAGGAAGTFVQNKLHNYLIEKLGWRESLRVYSGILSICIFAGFAYKPLQKHRTHPSVVEKFKTSPLRGFIVDLGLWKDRIFEVWVSSLGLAKFGFYIPFVHMMKHADDLGIPLEKASYIMVGLGVSSMISCLLFGKICDIENIDRLYLNQASILSVGVVYFIIPHCTSFASLVAICSLLGFFDAGNYVLLPVLTFDLVGAERMPVAWGFMMAVNAISCFGPPFAGIVYDMYGSYTIGFVVTGICYIAAASILALIPWLQREAVQSTKNYINASVCIITNTIVPWQSPTPSLGSISSSYTKSMLSPEQSTSGHSKGFSIKSFKSILKSDATSFKSGTLSPQITSDKRGSVSTVEYSSDLQEHGESTAEWQQDLGKSELTSLQSLTSDSLIQAEPIPHGKEDGVSLDEYEGDEEEQAEITTEVRPVQELTVPDAIFVKRERSDSKQMERIPHRKEDGVAFLDEYEGDEEEQAEIISEVRPVQELTVPETTFVKRERSDSKQMDRIPHRKEDGVAFLDEYEGDEEEQAEITTEVRP
ncbi:monocarboxylate transporter 10-like [Python bivittatus]|uniref:Monocarboxylate transporter 10-like n=1 Tax=Python bivittatus TaxID=176946 RepID=A0A9F5J6V9_PYTBI|nr:monocarboxylate transporter 10-like [Python bivittatus]